ncbi:MULTISPECIES: nuclear transport factor 2 family protein [Arthrobacter]|uniref:Nuclear transport factor 2 family protein n=1 Tax=Arthrobacter terricola TaxID=2547396 RepID=A0A4V2ZS33_9MICC|nr:MULTISPECIES: nuclear transport factor 2 family protein [Arthrobacter]MBT8163176.1 nuclear transport factor 2 family protein [Arthrobacter sp. GN70]TDF91254.1 nuclear transport factor 2 family protein [Arthrobacter terricola]
MTTEETTAYDVAALANDRAAMQDTLARYAWGYDEGNFGMLADTFTKEGTTSGKVAKSDASWGPTTGNQAIADRLKAIRDQQTDQRRHTIHTFRFENQTSSSADLYSYVLITATEKGVTKTLTAGWYHASMVKEADGQWRMAHLTVLLDSPF